MATLGEVTAILGISRNTVRLWCDEFKEFLSPTATPPKGKARTFAEEDLAVLTLVAQMRQNLATYGEIKSALADGERAEIPSREDGTNSGAALVLSRDYEQRLSIIQQEMASREGELRATKEERDHLRGELKEARHRNDELTERATRAETELEIRWRSTAPRPHTEAASAPADVSPTIEVQASEPQTLRVEVPKRSWWDRLRGR